MRDDLAKLPLPKSAKKYARLTAKDLGSDWSKKVDLYMDMAADLTNQSKEGFKNKDAAGKVQHAFKESDDGLASELGDVASQPGFYKNALRAAHTAMQHTDDPVTAVSNALHAVGALNSDGSPIRVSPLMTLGNFLTLHIADGHFDSVESLLKKHAPMLPDSAVQALMRVFREEGNNIKEMCMAESASRIVATLLENDDLLGQMGDVAGSPMAMYDAALSALHHALSEGGDSATAINAAIEAVGIDSANPYQGATVGDNISVYVADINIGGDVDEAVAVIQSTLESYCPGITESQMWALMRLFRTLVQEEFDARPQEVDQEPENEIDEWDDEGPVQEGDYGHANCHAFTAAMAKKNPRVEIFGLFDRRFPDEVAHSAVRLPDTETMVDAFGRHEGHAAWESAKHNFDQPENLEWRPMSAAKLSSLVQGDKARSVRQASKHVPSMESFDQKPYRYETCCVNADGDAITDMVDQATDVTYQEFMRNVPIYEIFQSGIGYGYYWTPAQAILGGVSYEEVSRNRPLTLKKDWHVTYHKSVYLGKPCYFMCHSAIEYVFVKD